MPNKYKFICRMLSFWENACIRLHKKCAFRHKNYPKERANWSLHSARRRRCSGGAIFRLDFQLFRSRNFSTPRGDKKTPRAAMAIPACGVGHLRVRRLQSPRAAFFRFPRHLPPFVVENEYMQDALTLIRIRSDCSSGSAMSRGTFPRCRTSLPSPARALPWQGRSSRWRCRPDGAA